MGVIFIFCTFALIATAASYSDLQEVLKKANDEFTASMFQKVVKTNKDKSCVLSAFSVLTPLAQLSFASVGETHDEITRAMGLPNDNVTKMVFADANSQFQAIKGVEIKQATKIYVRNKFELNDEFADTTKEIFNSEVQNIDFLKPTQAAETINTWVEDHTNRRIQHLVDAQSINNALIVLVNAIYFKGNWSKAFDKNSTKNETFYVTKDETVTLPMMSQSDYFKYKESQYLDAQVLELEYEGGDTSLVVVLPNEIDGIDDLIEKLKSPDALNEAIYNNNIDMFTPRVEVYLPKFKIETTTDLKSILRKMNIKSLFNKARLDRLLKQPVDISISTATQKAFIEVNEEGTEAAAANQFTGVILALPPPETTTFNANHPFVYFLMQNNLILFTGVFRSP